MENPNTQPHYLTTFFPVKPKLIDNDRSERGDYYKKPTQFWFVNCDPHYNFVAESLTYVETGTKDRPPKMQKNDVAYKTKRSMMSPHYARRFILEHIMDADEGVIFGSE